ncbi:copper resistance CopC family protein [Sulfitobacter sp. SK011]|uniref:copper resistance CopC family protein n=1 Tax=Sulfitobacter sp. SK011 TaxID=1389004 RepID=UPI000E0BCB5F|nr:copper resistance CopC family protein [Sulfitobacter sp. SK011]AXI44262.1 copper resistance protein CopC [Sulfitobacter sp. SK011]
MKQIFLTGMIGFWATGALAHSPLDSTTPAHEATIAEAPTEVLLDFKGDIRLTRVTMQHGPHPSSDLDLSGHAGFISDYAIPMQGMGSGDYVIEWRGLAADGHALNGTFSFTVE